ncbi:MAG: ATP-binding protein [Steroidobacteraceae bacterium]
MTAPTTLTKVHGTELLPGDSRELYRQKIARITLDSMVQFVGLLDAKGTVLEINKVALDAVGKQLSDVAGRPFWHTFWWQVSEEVNATLRDSIARAAAGEFVRWDTEIYGRAGGTETIVIDASLMPVKDERGEVVFIAAEGRDITEKKAYEREIARQREELAKLDQLKTQFFANISHEFRTPLTLMIGPLEDALANPEELSSANRERLELAHRNSLRQLKLVNTLLDFARIEAGRIQASYEPVDLTAFTAELASTFRSAVERAGMKFTINCSPLSESPYVDREMWEKIVLNLLSNAFKFTFEGEIEVALQEVNRAVVLTVRDTGTGIAAGEQPRLFDRFYRVRGARGRSYEGSGIGLALVKELARLHGGSVRVESRLDEGSRFIVSIPLGKDHLPADRIEAARTLTSTASSADAYVAEALRWLPDDASGSVQAEPLAQLSDKSTSRSAGAREITGRILFVDDNADMREYVHRLLVQEGHEVELVHDGLAALDAMRLNRPDLVLSDVMMPRLDGFGLLREVRADASLSDLPVILLSARAGQEARIEGLEASADDYLIKPFSARELIARVDSHLRMKRFRQQATAALRESEGRFRALVLASCDVVYRMSADWTEMRYLDGREFIADTLEPSRHWLDKYILAGDQPRVLAAIHAAIQRKLPFEYEHRVVRVDGSLGWTFSRAIPILDADGEIVEWFGMASDITARKELEASLRDADRRKDEFLATLAHELRNPLAPIRNSVQLLRAAEVPDLQVRKARDIIERQVHHMVRLVDDLMDVSRITLGQVNLKRDRVSLRGVIADALEAAGPVIEARKHALSVQLPAESLHLEGDATRLSQVFQNLLNNAAKYTPAGGQITLSAERCGAEVAVVVRDTGIGIPRESQQRVFELFTRVNPGDRIKTSGLGIGLALAKQLVHLHGGRIEVHSDGADAGSEFIVRLPVLAEQGKQPQAVADTRGKGGRLSGQRVLVVDDNVDAADSLALFIEMEGASTRVAVDGEQALAALEAFEPEIVILDIGMPHMDGYEAARRMRASSQGRELTLIALTGWGQADDKRRALAAGFDEHLTKPVDPEMLVTLLGVRGLQAQ